MFNLQNSTALIHASEPLTLPPSSFIQPSPLDLQQSVIPLALTGSSSAVHTVAFVDASLPDYQTLVQGMQPNTAVYMLNPNGDELGQMTQVLTRYQNLASVVVFDHGSNGALQFGNTNLNSANLPQYAAMIQSWSESLATEADLLFYGCDLAGDAVGQTFVRQIAGLTGADVAASTDLTGSTVLGGNWNLEFSTGKIEASNPLAEWAQAAYQYALQTFTVTHLGDAGDGSLRAAIAQANTTQGPDTIDFAAGLSGTIALTSGQLELNDVTGQTTIDGANAITITGNNTFRIFQIYSEASTELNGLTISGGNAGDNGYGGGIFNSGTLTVNNSTLTNNTGSYLGGGIFNGGTLTVNNSTIANNNVLYSGGGIYNTNTLTVNNSTIANNNAFRGGGIFNASALTVNNSTIANNTASTDGGGIFNANTMTVNDSMIANNNVLHSGGGIYNTNTLTVNNSTIANNSAPTGGGICNYHTMTVNNSTIAINTASIGGGIYNSNTMTVNNSTIATNIAYSSGGGIYIDIGSTIISNSIIAGNTSPFSLSEVVNLGSSVTSNYNLLGASNETFAQAFYRFTPSSTDLVATSDSNRPTALSDILDTTLRDNGGPTLTLALVAGSPAINAGDPNYSGTLTTDQRGTGFARIVGSRIDIGAFEYVLPNSAPVNTVPGTQTSAEDTPLIFSSDNGNALSIADDSTSLTTIVSITDGTGRLTATPDSGATITSNGTSRVIIAGSVTQINAALNGLIYTPSADANGTAYTILTLTTSDGSLSDTDTVTINITPVNDAPVAVNDSVTTTDLQTVIIPVLTNDRDVDTGDTISILSFTQPASGSIIQNVDNTFTYAPVLGFVGNTSFNYTIQDGAGLTATATVTITVTQGTNIIVGTTDDDNLVGTSRPDRIEGLAGNDTLNGAAGADTLIGSMGNDIYVVDALDTLVENEGEGTDLVRSAITYSLANIANVENLTLTGSANINGTGNVLDNVITGNSGINILTGGAGNDTYIVGTGDTIVENEGEGTDLVQSSVTFSIANFNNVENLTLTGSAASNGTGNTRDNVITGNSASNILNGGDGNDTLNGAAGNDTLNGAAGNDTLNGGTGRDRMEGGTGDDIYVVDNEGDRVIEAANSGIDTVQASISWTLGSNVENLTLTGSQALEGIGNGLDNRLIGNAGANYLSGGGGNDQLEGGAGKDELNGGSGNDILIGGAGSDTLTGGTGNDLFVYNSFSDHGDTITDFSTALDTLDLSALLDSLGYTGSNPINDGFLRLTQSGSNTLVQIDQNGATGGASFSNLVTLNGVNRNNLTLGTNVLI